MGLDMCKHGEWYVHMISHPSTCGDWFAHARVPWGMVEHTFTIDLASYSRLSRLWDTLI